MAVNIPGVIFMVLFYLLVLGTGIWASFKSKREQKKSGANKTEMTLLGNRSINWVVGIFTMTATWVGGGLIVGTAEMVYTPSMGLTWAAMMMTAYSLSLIIFVIIYTLLGGLYSVAYTVLGQSPAGDPRHWSREEQRVVKLWAGKHPPAGSRISPWWWKNVLGFSQKPLLSSKPRPLRSISDTQLA
ncbi:unnamed protein product [Pleuronectes platessa]|uniref:High-affinity choline transporter 1-like n=1 Tax=Pleuronectes platessa TaxID=8262 RepID=A0A9N7VDI5_PLEPL|nr:unnamed protein product [Pleuronectes platessa]